MPDKKISELDALPNGLLDTADEWVIQRAAADNYRVSQAELEARMDALYAPLPHVNDTSIHFPDAPSDGNQYARQNGSWAIVTGGGGPGAGVSSWNGRTGAVVPVANDYTSSQVQNLSAVSGSTVTNALNALNSQIPSQNLDVLDGTAQLITYAGGAYQKFEPGADNTFLQITRPGGVPTLAWAPVSNGIGDGTITNAKLADMPANTVKLRVASAGPPTDAEIENLSDLGIPAAGDRILVQKEGGDIGQVQIGNLPGGGGGGIDPIFITHTWTLSGTFTNSTFVVPFLVASGAYNLKLVRVEALMESGAFTNAKIQQRTGAAAAVDVPGLTTMSVTAGVPATFTPTTGGGQPLANNDRLYLVWTDSFGGAADLQLSVVVSHQTAP